MTSPEWISFSSLEARQRLQTAPADEQKGAIPLGIEGWYDVTAFGAKGDGSTDDTGAVLNAINFMESKSQGGVLYFPPGTYLVSNIVLARPTWILGAGNYRSTILHNPKATDNLITTSESLIVSSITIDGNKSNQGVCNRKDLIRFVAGPTASFVADNVRFQKATAPAIHADSIDNLFL